MCAYWYNERISTNCIYDKKIVEKYEEAMQRPVAYEMENESVHKFIEEYQMLYHIIITKVFTK